MAKPTIDENEPRRGADKDVDFVAVRQTDDRAVDFKNDAWPSEGVRVEREHCRKVAVSALSFCVARI